MPGEVDPRLIAVLQSVIALVDQVRDAGAEGDLHLRFNREDGLRLLHLVSGASDPEAEQWSQRAGLGEPGVNRIKVAGLYFEWPQEKTSQACGVGDVLRIEPSIRSLPANDNGRAPSSRWRLCGFEEEKPILL